MSERYDRIRRIRREKRRQRRQQRTLKKSMKYLFGWLITILTAAVLGYGFVAFGFQKALYGGAIHDSGYTGRTEVCCQ